MRFFEFFRKNRKAVAAAAGLILVCVSIVLLTRAAGKRAAEQSQEVYGEMPGNESMLKTPEDSATKPLAEPQTQQTSEQEPGGEPSEPVNEPQTESTEESESTGESQSTEEPESVGESKSTEESPFTEEPKPVLTEEYELIYEGINLFDVFHYAAFKYMNTQADLYMRRLRDDTGEYIELSLWSDQGEIWYTIDSMDINSDYAGDYDLFYWGHSERLTLDQKLCYYVIPLEGTVYLMRYGVETTSDAVTMSYKVFGISPMVPYSFQGSEAPLDVGSITVYLVSNGDIDPAVSFPVEEMTAFADTVKGYMENGYLAASTLGGVFEFGSSADRDNPVSSYLFDVFPWIPEQAAKCGVNAEGIYSTEQMLTAIQNALPTDTSVVVPDVADDGTCFITGDYYSDSDESYLTVHMGEDGSYGGHLLIANALNMDFTGDFDNGILTVMQTDNSPDCPPYELEVSFQKGKATVTVTAADEEYFIKVGEAFTMDRNEKPEGLEVMRHASPHRVE